MTEVKKSLPTKYYFNIGAIETLYKLFFQRFKEFGEPIPHWDFVNKKKIEQLVEIPKTSFFGQDQYPSLEDKAAEIFYYVNKGHIFPNGNKRLSVACTIVFLGINGYELVVNPDVMTRKALEIAESDSLDFKKVKKNLSAWILENLKEAEPLE